MAVLQLCKNRDRDTEKTDGKAVRMLSLVYVSVKLVFGTLYPTYCSFKAVKNRNVKEYVQWMTYWIVFSVMTVAEQVADIFLSFWFPFYYALKILLLAWLLSPSTRGSTFLYRQVIHPALTKREEDIDDFVQKCKEDGIKYTRAVAHKMTSRVIETAVAGGGGLVRSLRHSYSISDLRSVHHDQGYGSGGIGGVEEESRLQEYGRGEAKVKMRSVRGRSRVPLESTVSLTSDSDLVGVWREEKKYNRRRKTSSLYATLPKGGCYGAMPRSGTKHEVLARRTRTLTNDNLTREEIQETKHISRHSKSSRMTY